MTEFLCLFKFSSEIRIHFDTAATKKNIFEVRILSRFFSRFSSGDNKSLAIILILTTNELKKLYSSKSLIDNENFTSTIAEVCMYRTIIG
jgi:hypothetical protein